MKKEIVIPLPDGAQEGAHDYLKAEMCSTYGGVTIQEGRGEWVGPAGDRIGESVRVYACVADDGGAKHSAQHWARHVKEITQEESVMWYVRELSAGGFE